VGILTHEFRPSLSVETFDYIGQYLPDKDFMLESGIPMVCFCDIPLSQVGTHMTHYGQYGIGLTKKWGISKGITPVLYTHSKSVGPRTIARLVGLLDALAVESASEDIKRLALASGEVAYFLKPYEGTLIRGDRQIENVRFYDEREWRFVPDEIEEIAAISREELADSTKSREVREQVDRLPSLSFEPWDINYLIVATEDEILPMFRDVQRIKEKYDQGQKDTLCTKIVSAERIRRDF
jgi:hypothetical protein